MMEGHTERFWQLIEPEHLKARSFCRKLTGNRDDGDDLYQDALVAALVGFSSLRDEMLVKPWFYRIIINRYKNLKRRSWVKRLQPLTDEIARTIGGSNPEPMYTARNRLEIAFEALSPEERVLVTLFELEGWTIAELARLQGKKEGNIKVKLSRIRKKMRNRLAKLYLPSKGKKETEPLETRDAICVAGKSEKN